LLRLRTSTFDVGDSVILQDGTGVAIDGYDPVSYFADTGPLPGDAAFEANHDGAKFRFASAENRDVFVADPARFAPAYGGWCAWAIADGGGALVEVDPESFLIQDGRLLLFYDGWLADTRGMWLAEETLALGEQADANWERLEATAR
jgi:hypothetical protein